MNFSRPLEVSTGYRVDRVLITLMYYVDYKLVLYTLEGDLPQMVRSVQELETLQASAEAAG